jgi:hypothetical protein
VFARIHTKCTSDTAYLRDIDVKKVAPHVHSWLPCYF